MVALIFLAGAVGLLLGYRFYGRKVSKWLGVDNSRPTPAHTFSTDPSLSADPSVKHDYCPAKAPVLFGHHFSSIAGAGPIVGPIVAAAAFGWAPVALWILIGAVLIGGVQDFSTLMTSIRNKARSIGHIAKQYVSPLGYRLLLVFIYLTLLYVMAVFLDLTSTTFVKSGAVATASGLYIVLAVAFGLLVYRSGVPFWLGTIIFVPLVFAGAWLGEVLPAGKAPSFLGNPGNFWDALLVMYMLAASLLPVWVLLQPRDYLSSFLLFGCLAVGLAGIVVGSISGNLGGPMSVDAFTGWSDPHLGFVLPVLFITVACGATSGFHTVVASGTTAKQLDKESDARPVAYGGMLLEGVLGLVALSAILVVGRGAGSPTLVFGAGIGRFVGALGLDPQMGANFGLLAVSTFLLTTLDTSTRLGRYVFEEIFEVRGWTGRLTATLITVAIPALFVFPEFTGPHGVPVPSWKLIWPIFGATNQLLGALAMVVVVLYLRHRGRSWWYVAAPCVFMMAVTITALAQLAFFGTHTWLVRSIAAGLLALALLLVVEAVRAFLKEPSKAAEPTG